MSKRRDPSRELPRPMTGDDLARFASAAYGAVGWQSALARDLDCPGPASIDGREGSS